MWNKTYAQKWGQRAWQTKNDTARSMFHLNLGNYFSDVWVNAVFFCIPKDLTLPTTGLPLGETSVVDHKISFSITNFSWDPWDSAEAKRRQGWCYRDLQPLQNPLALFTLSATKLHSPLPISFWAHHLLCCNKLNWLKTKSIRCFFLE